MNIIIDASGNVLMWSENGTPTPDVGQQLVPLTDEQAANLLQLTTTPNGGLRFDGVSVTALDISVPVMPALTVDQKLAQIGLSVAILSSALSVVAQPAPPPTQEVP